MLRPQQNICHHEFTPGVDTADFIWIFDVTRCDVLVLTTKRQPTQSHTTVSLIWFGSAFYG